MLLAMRVVLGNNQKTMGFDYLQSARKLGSWAGSFACDQSDEPDVAI